MGASRASRASTKHWPGPPRRGSPRDDTKHGGSRFEARAPQDGANAPSSWQFAGVLRVRRVHRLVPRFRRVPDVVRDRSVDNELVMTQAQAQRRIPVIVVLPPRTLLLDVAGPIEVLRRANLIQDRVRFDVRFVGATRALRTSIGLTVSGVAPLPHALPADALIVVAGNVDTFIDGSGTAADDDAHDTMIVDWLRASIRPGHRLVTICSGATLAARAGLFDGYSCTTHYLDCERLAAAAPGAKVLDNRLYVEDRDRLSSAGITAGIDLMLHLIAQFVDHVCALAVAPVAIIATGLIEFIGPEFTRLIPPPAFPGNTPRTLVVLGLAITSVGVLAAPALLRAYGLVARSILAPGGEAELELRVQQLTETRTEALDTGAAEIRRIERDLHDGAQARLVAMGMTLDAAGQIIDSNPDAARALVLEARDASVKALAELRALVRGIHPPVLADRGLADAIRALALDASARISLASDLNGRPPAPVESAAYFAVCELLANVSKHAEARQTWVDIRHTDGMLRIGVTDNGHGGAEPARGTGLSGIERRLAAFDGVLAISSPPGGPTAVTMEVPCALSSPKTSSC